MDVYQPTAQISSADTAATEASRPNPCPAFGLPTRCHSCRQLGVGTGVPVGVSLGVSVGVNVGPPGVIVGVLVGVFVLVGVLEGVGVFVGV